MSSATTDQGFVQYAGPGATVTLPARSAGLRGLCVELWSRAGGATGIGFTIAMRNPAVEGFWLQFGADVGLRWGRQPAAGSGDALAAGIPILFTPTGSVLRTWRHFALSWSADTGVARCYCDGAGIARWTGLAGLPDDLTSLVLVLSEGAAIADVRFWDHARSGAEIAGELAFAVGAGHPGLLGSWPCDDDRLTDASGNGADGGMVNAQIAAGGALSFRRPDSSERHRAASRGGLAAARTAAAEELAAVRAQAQATATVARARGEDARRRAHAAAEDELQRKRIVEVVAIADDRMQRVLPDGSVRSLADDNLRLWIDGKPAGTFTRRRPTAAASGDLWLGTRPGWTDRLRFRGDLRDVAVWSRALSAEDLAAIRGQRLRGDEAGLVSAWTARKVNLVAPPVIAASIARAMALRLRPPIFREPPLRVPPGGGPVTVLTNVVSDLGPAQRNLTLEGTPAGAELPAAAPGDEPMLRLRGEYARLPQPDASSFPAGALTVSAWIRPERTPEQGTILSWGFPGLELQVQDGRLVAEIVDWEEYAATAPIRFGEWQHVAASLVDTEAIAAAHVSDLAIDYGRGRLAWATRYPPFEIWAAGLDGAGPRRLATSAGAPIPTVAIDPGAGQVYWIEGAGQIRRVALAGGAAETLLDITTVTRDPTWRLVVDHEANRLYWSDASSVRTCKLDGTDLRTAIGAGDAPFPADLAIDSDGGFLYWIDRELRMLRRASLRGDAVHWKPGATATLESTAVPPGNQWTVELWVCPEGEPADAAVWAGDELRVALRGGWLHVVRPGDDMIIGRAPVAAGVWFHLAIVSDGTGLTALLDGRPLPLLGAVNVRLTGFALVPGQAPSTPPTFTGFLDELRVWSVARTAGELTDGRDRRAEPRADGLHGYWRFDGTDATLRDLGAGAHPLTIAGTDVGVPPASPFSTVEDLYPLVSPRPGIDLDPESGILAWCDLDRAGRPAIFLGSTDGAERATVLARVPASGSLRIVTHGRQAHEQRLVAWRKRELARRQAADRVAAAQADADRVVGAAQAGVTTAHADAGAAVGTAQADGAVRNQDARDRIAAAERSAQDRHDRARTAAADRGRQADTDAASRKRAAHDDAAGRRAAAQARLDQARRERAKY